MVKTLREWEKALSQAVDTDYSYGLARRMEGYKSNAALGYRTRLLYTSDAADD